jgi:type IV pilus assembly protein PilV
MSRRATRRRAAAGFTLIEMLVALVVLGIGMLGIGKLFLYTLQGNASATSRTIAVNFAADLADRIRANRSAQAAYAGASPITAAPAPVCIGGALSLVPVCTPAQMAAYDLYQWDQQVRCTGQTSTTATATCWAAGPSWSVVYTANPAGLGPNAYAITLNWLEPSTGQQLNYTLNVQI